MNIVDSAIQVLKGKIPDSPEKSIILDSLKTSVLKQEQSIQELIQALKSGDLSQQEFDMEMEREQQIIEAEMLTWQIVSKSEIQKIVEEFFNIVSSEAK